MFEQVKSILVDKLGIQSEITMDAALVNDLGINSIELADLILNCEEEFDIAIDEEDLKDLVTVGDVVNYLESKVNG